MIRNLITSRKAVVMMLATIGSVLLAVFKQISWHDTLEFSKWTIVMWLGSQAAIDAVDTVRNQHLQVANNKRAL